MSNKTCGECKHYLAEMTHCKKHDCFALDDDRCEDFEPKVITNGDRLRQLSNEELAEISIYEDTMPDGEIIYRSTLIVDKFFLTKNRAVSVVKAWLNAPAESEGCNG